MSAQNEHDGMGAILCLFNRFMGSCVHCHDEITPVRRFGPSRQCRHGAPSSASTSYCRIIRKGQEACAIDCRHVALIGICR